MEDDRARLEMAISAMRSAIILGVEIPSEFAPFVNQYLPGLAKEARFAERQGLIERMMGAAPEEPQISTDSKMPKRNILPDVATHPSGEVRTRTPNVYRGPLDDSLPPVIPSGDPEWWRRRI
ncbi:MAG: hypothetical protein HY322_18610 [Betaproteobacteria bacterium]|nr:hypothetical protein [Betaproteobacteria bacterium]